MRYELIDRAWGAIRPMLPNNPLIFGTVQMGIFFTGVDTDWFKVFMGGMVLIAVLFNTYVRRKINNAR